MSKQASSQWFEQLLQPVKNELLLREALEPARRSELNEKLKREDQLAVKRTIFVSALTLFNLSLAAVYAIAKTPPSKRVIVMPILFCSMVLCTYKLGVQWLNR